MEFVAKARYIDCSPYKLRPFARVIQGKNIDYACNWLFAYRSQRSRLLKKVLDSAIANARHSQQNGALRIKSIMVDQGPIRRYFKPGAQGRAQPQARRFSHITIIVEALD